MLPPIYSFGHNNLMERPSIHRVFEGGSPIKLSGPNVFQATDINSAYRLTGSPQIQDIIESGNIRSKVGKIKGGRVGEVHWSAGHPKLAYASSPTTESYVLQTPIKDVRGRFGGLPATQAKVWHSPIGTTEWRDITPKIQQQVKVIKPVIAREAGRDLMPAARTLGRALGSEAASLGGMALRGAGRLAGPVGAIATAYDAATTLPALARDWMDRPTYISDPNAEAKIQAQALRDYRTGNISSRGVYSSPISTYTPRFPVAQ